MEAELKRQIIEAKCLEIGFDARMQSSMVGLLDSSHTSQHLGKDPANPLFWQALREVTAAFHLQDYAQYARRFEAPAEELGFDPAVMLMYHIDIEVQRAQLERYVDDAHRLMPATAY